MSNDSDSFITLTIMWGSVGRIEKLPLVNQWPTRDYTPLHSAALRSAPFRHSWVIGSLVVIFQFYSHNRQCYERVRIVSDPNF